MPAAMVDVAPRAEDVGIEQTPGVVAVKRFALVAAAWALAGAAFAETPPSELVTLHALHQQYVENVMWCGQGDVEIRYQDVTLRCDQVEVDVKTLQLHAQGNVTFDQADTRMACTRLDFDLRRKIGTLYEVQASFPPTYHFRGDELEKLDETHYRFHRGTFTSCTVGDNRTPTWSIQIRDAIVEIEGYGHFRGASLRVHGVPVFYTPRLLWPIKRDRAAGFLVPSFGRNSQAGAYIGNSFYWPVSRSFDTTFLADFYSKGYLGLGTEMRWAPTETGRGDITGGFIRDPNTKIWQWKVQGKHVQLFPGGYTFSAQVQEMSDVDFFQQFENTIDQTALRTLYTTFTLSRAWGPQALNIRADRNKTFLGGTTTGVTTSTEVVLERQPEAEYRLRNTRIGRTPLYLALVGVADQLLVDRSATLHGRYQRFGLIPTLSLVAPGFTWLSITPTVGFRYMHYSEQNSADNTTLLGQPLTSKNLTGGLSIVGPSFSRIWTEEDGGAVKHLIEPRLEYTYLSDPGDITRVPVFDEKDSVLAAHKLKWTLSNRIFLKSPKTGSREVVSLEISQEYSFKAPLTFQRPGFPPSQLGPLSFWLRAVPFRTASFDARADLDPVTHNLQDTSLSGGITSGASALNLTWYSSFDPVLAKPLSSQARTSFAWSPGAGSWRLEGQVAFDIQLHNLLEQRYGFRYRGSCWSAAVELRDLRILPYPTKDYRITIDLTGLGTFLDIKGGLGGF